MCPVRPNANGFGLSIMGVVVVVVVIVVVVGGGSDEASNVSRRSKNVHKGRCTRESVA